MTKRAGKPEIDRRPTPRPILIRELLNLADRLERRGAYYDGLGNYDTASAWRQAGNELRSEIRALEIWP